MTKEQAEATGLLVTSLAQQPFPACPAGARFRTESGSGGMALHSTTLGIAVITAPPHARTVEGIAAGAPKAEMLKAYPDWREGVQGGVVKVPGNAKAVYRISVSNGVVDELSLELANQDCYK